MNSKISQFPITPYLSEICSELKNSQSKCVILTAETGAGKSTILPIGLLENFEGKILMTEPRRLAVLGVANRVADLLDEEPGKTVGYRIQLETKKTETTRLEVVTEALLVRELQNDPALEKYNVVVLDEFHERSVHMDLALAFLKEAMELRDDLYVVIMSATIDAKRISLFMGKENSVPEISIPGRTFPVTIEYKPETSPTSVALRELNECKQIKKDFKDTILIFLPGIYEIKKYEEELKEALQYDDTVEVNILHSSVNIEDQKRILKPAEKIRIILSSAIAETSLTIPGVTVVIDSGRCRINKLNISNGMENLVTEMESEFSARQRAGRAGRELAGKCIRLWGEKEILSKETEPEILRTDLCSVVLECAERGIYDLETLSLLDAPSKASWISSVETLKMLGCLKADGRILPKGKQVLKLGVSTRIACIALAEAEWELKSKIILKYSSYSKSSSEVQRRFLNQIKNNITGNSEKVFTNGRLTLEGFPDRLAKKTGTLDGGKTEYQFVTGRKAICEVINGPEWIVGAEVLAGDKIAKIFSYEVIENSEVGEWINNKLETKEECYFDEGKIQKFERKYFGKILISEKKLNSTQEDYASAWVGELKAKGLEALPINKKTESFLNRVKFYNQQKNLQEKNLTDGGEEWLRPFISSGKKLDENTVYEALYWYLNGAEIDKEVPEILVLKNGCKAKVKYEYQALSTEKTKLVIRPVIEIIIQRIFGCFETPEILGMKVLLKLLSPASRPLQITEDLENFWKGTWQEICKEMKGRYPKHNWDYKIYEGENRN